MGAWIISLTHARARVQWQSQMTSYYAKQQAKLAGVEREIFEKLRALEAQTPAKLAAQVAELSDAVSRVADTHRRFAGKVWAHIGERKAPPVANGEIGDEDGELAAMLALQSKPATPPQ